MEGAADGGALLALRGLSYSSRHFEDPESLLLAIPANAGVARAEAVVARALAEAGPLPGPLARLEVRADEAPGGLVSAARLLAAGRAGTVVVLALDAAAAMAAVLTLPGESGSTLVELTAPASGEGPRPGHLDDVELAVVADGDAGELRRLGLARRPSGRLPWCAVATSPRSEPPFAGFVLAASAVRCGILPAGEPPFASEGRSPLFSLSAPTAWRPRRAGAARVARLAGRGGRDVLLRCSAPPEAPRVRPSELLVLSASDREGLAERCRELALRIETLPRTGYADLAAALARAHAGRFRVAVVGGGPAELVAHLALAERFLAQPGSLGRVSPRGVSFCDSESRRLGPVLLMYPGQGSQYPRMLCDLWWAAPQARAWLDRLDASAPDAADTPSRLLLAPEGLPADARGAVTDYLWTLLGGGLAAMFAAFALDDCLAAAGVPRDGYLGYSNGENTALLVSGLLRLKLRELGGAMQRVRGDRPEPPPPAPGDDAGVILAVSGLARRAVEEVVERHPGQAFLALDNCPSQVVVFASRAVWAAVRSALRRAGAVVVRLPYDRPIHTPLFTDAEKIVDDLYANARPGASPVPVYSSSSAAPIAAGPEAVRSCAVALWTRPVRFRETVLRAWDDGYRVFVEVGPGGMLGGFVRDTLRGREAEALSTDLRHRQTLRQLQQVLGRLFTLGAEIDLAPLLPPAAGSPPRDA